MNPETVRQSPNVTASINSQLAEQAYPDASLPANEAMGDVEAPLSTLNSAGAQLGEDLDCGNNIFKDISFINKEHLEAFDRGFVITRSNLSRGRSCGSKPTSKDPWYQMGFYLAKYQHFIRKQTKNNSKLGAISALQLIKDQAVELKESNTFSNKKLCKRVRKFIRQHKKEIKNNSSSSTSSTSPGLTSPSSPSCSLPVIPLSEPPKKIRRNRAEEAASFANNNASIFKDISFVNEGNLVEFCKAFLSCCSSLEMVKKNVLRECSVHPTKKDPWFKMGFYLAKYQYYTKKSTFSIPKALEALKRYAVTIEESNESSSEKLCKIIHEIMTEKRDKFNKKNKKKKPRTHHNISTSAAASDAVRVATNATAAFDSRQCQKYRGYSLSYYYRTSSSSSADTSQTNGAATLDFSDIWRNNLRKIVLDRLLQSENASAYDEEFKPIATSIIKHSGEFHLALLNKDLEKIGENLNFEVRQLVEQGIDTSKLSNTMIDFFQRYRITYENSPQFSLAERVSHVAETIAKQLDEIAKQNLEQVRVAKTKIDIDEDSAIRLLEEQIEYLDPEDITTKSRAKKRKRNPPANAATSVAASTVTATVDMGKGKEVDDTPILSDEDEDDVEMQYAMQASLSDTQSSSNSAEDYSISSSSSSSNSSSFIAANSAVEIVMSTTTTERQPEPTREQPANIAANLFANAMNNNIAEFYKGFKTNEGNSYQASIGIHSAGDIQPEERNPWYLMGSYLASYQNFINVLTNNKATLSIREALQIVKWYAINESDRLTSRGLCEIVLNFITQNESELLDLTTNTSSVINSFNIDEPRPPNHIVESIIKHYGEFHMAMSQESLEKIGSKLNSSINSKNVLELYKIFDFFKINRVTYDNCSQFSMVNCVSSEEAKMIAAKLDAIAAENLAQIITAETKIKIDEYMATSLFKKQSNYLRTVAYHATVPKPCLFLVIDPFSFYTQIKYSLRLVLVCVNQYGFKSCHPVDGLVAYPQLNQLAKDLLNKISRELYVALYPFELKGQFIRVGTKSIIDQLDKLIVANNAQEDKTSVDMIIRINHSAALRSHVQMRRLANAAVGAPISATPDLGSQNNGITAEELEQALFTPSPQPQVLPTADPVDPISQRDNYNTLPFYREATPSLLFTPTFDTGQVAESMGPGMMELYDRANIP